MYWPPGRPKNQNTFETDYDTSNIHSQTFYLPGLEADREYVLAVQVKTTGGPSPGSNEVQFKTTQGSMFDKKIIYFFYMYYSYNKT